MRRSIWAVLGKMVIEEGQAKEGRVREYWVTGFCFGCISVEESIHCGACLRSPPDG